MFKPARIASCLGVASVLAFSLPVLRAGDCNENGVDDQVDLVEGTSLDCNLNGVPDECEETSLLLEAAAAYGVESLSGFGLHLLADLDGDADLDLAVPVRHDFRRLPGHPYDRSLAVFLNEGDGTFSDPELYETGFGPVNLLAQDLDGDGSLDLVTLDRAGLTVDEYGVSVFINRGDGRFDRSARLDIGNNPRGLGAADLDGRNGLDLYFTNVGDETLTVLLSDGDGTFAGATHYPAKDGPRSPRADDFDGDGDLDIALVEKGSGTGDVIGNTLAIYWNRGDGRFDEPTSIPGGTEPIYLVLGDVDGDGRNDLLSANLGSEDAVLHRNLGGGRFSAARSVDVGGRPLFVGTNPIP